MVSSRSQLRVETDWTRSALANSLSWIQLDHCKDRVLRILKIRKPTDGNIHCRYNRVTTHRHCIFYGSIAIVDLEVGNPVRWNTFHVISQFVHAADVSAAIGKNRVRRRERQLFKSPTEQLRIEFS